jgi:hypothetical protein
MQGADTDKGGGCRADARSGRWQRQGCHADGMHCTWMWLTSILNRSPAQKRMASCCASWLADLGLLAAG